MKKIITIILIMTVLNSFCIAEETVNKNLNILNIFVAKMKPCVILEEDEMTREVAVSGFEIDLWKTVARELVFTKVIDDWKFIPVEWSEIEKGIKDGSADVACSGLTIRLDRMEWASFSMPTMNSGLGIMVLQEDGVGMFAGFVLMLKALQGPIIFFVSFIVIFAVIIWALEKDKDPDNDDNGISDAFFPGIFEAIYFCIVTCSTVGYGDFAPKKWRTRALTVLLIVVGLAAFGNFLSLISVARIEDSIGSITGPSDLEGKVVLTQKGTTSVATVKSFGAKIVTTDDIDSACDGLLLERGDAVVFDYPVLLNYVKENPDKVKMVGDMFDEQYYGFMLQKDSPLEKKINMALLRIYENGTYKTLYDKWF